MSERTVADIQDDLNRVRRALKRTEAKDSLASFIHLMMPDPEDPGDAAKSEYQVRPHARLLCEIIEKVERGDLKRVAVSIPPQHGKPVAEHELVLMGDGSRKALRDVVVGDEVITHEGRPRVVEAVYVQGELDCLRIATASGRVVEAAPDHPFLTPRGWVRADALRIGEPLAQIEPAFCAPVEHGAAEVARLLGYFVGDGNTTKNGATIAANITAVDPVVRQDIVACAEALGFSALVRSYGKRAARVLLGGGVRRFLREHGLVGCSSHQKRVPLWVFTSPVPIVAEFIGAYFACDGSVNRRGGARKDVCLEWYSVNRDLLRDVQHLLLRLGVQSTLGVKNGRYKGERHLSHRLTVTSQHFAARLLARMPIRGEKAARLAEWRPQETFAGRYLPDPVVAVEVIGKRPCRCLSVAEDRSFTAADFVVHNTIHLSTFGPAWILGRNPRAKVIIASYNETRAEELGEAFRKLVTSDEYRNTFPEMALERGSKSKSAMSTTRGGRIFFVGTGGTVTGRTADYFIIDDPMKDDEEMQSDISREKMWKWFFSVAYSRGSKRTRIIVLHTRWHADDLIGRLCDPSHPEREKRFAGVADDWAPPKGLFLNISGVVQSERLAEVLGLELKKPTDPKVIRAFGDKPMAALWEEEKPLEFFAPWKLGEPRTFSALVMGQPSIEDGEYFKKEYLLEYDVHQLPRDLRKYGASDHAVSEKQGRDYTVAGCVGVDTNDDIWVLPDISWDRMETDRTVEELLYHFKTHKPGLWWMEDELISKSFGPFLRKRMQELRTYVTIDTVRPAKDKKTRARAIQGRMQMGKVHFPRFAPWWANARSELLQFPYGAHDDFVDWLAHIGMGLLKEGRPSKAVSNDNVLRIGSPEWIMRAAMVRARREGRDKAVAGW